MHFSDSPVSVRWRVYCWPLFAMQVDLFVSCGITLLLCSWFFVPVFCFEWALYIEINRYIGRRQLQTWWRENVHFVFDGLFSLWVLFSGNRGKWRSSLFGVFQRADCPLSPNVVFSSHFLFRYSYHEYCRKFQLIQRAVRHLENQASVVRFDPAIWRIEICKEDGTT